MVIFLVSSDVLCFYSIPQLVGRGVPPPDAVRVENRREGWNCRSGSQLYWRKETHAHQKQDRGREECGVGGRQPCTGCREVRGTEAGPRCSRLRWQMAENGGISPETQAVLTDAPRSLSQHHIHPRVGHQPP